MTERRDVIAAMAGDIAIELDPLVDEFLRETDLHKKQNVGIRIRQLLWDNKVGILRVMQTVGGKHIERRIHGEEVSK